MIVFMKRLFSFLFFISSIALVHAQTSPPIRYGDNPEAGGFKKVNGVRLYYEIYGSGQPLIFLHGSGGSIRSARAKIDYFKKNYQVIAIDSRAHGKSTDDVSKPLTYVQMASDINVLLDSLHVRDAFVSGQSDGGILGLLLAIHYPDKVARVATFGANLFPGTKAVFDEVDQLVRDTLKVTKNEHTKRLYGLLAYQPNITEKDLQQIKCPVLIMSGDRDVIRLEHSLKIFYNIPNSNFFVMPGATHFGAAEKPDLFNLVLSDFLTRPFSKVSTVDLITGKH
jgi:pimeloyl-ACP methyl ester carboxylesterase